jgi:hypothetical protein
MRQHAGGAEEFIARRVRLFHLGAKVRAPAAAQAMIK